MDPPLVEHLHQSNFFTEDTFLDDVQIDRYWLWGVDNFIVAAPVYSLGVGHVQLVIVHHKKKVWVVHVIDWNLVI